MLPEIHLSDNAQSELYQYRSDFMDSIGVQDDFLTDEEMISSITQAILDAISGAVELDYGPDDEEGLDIDFFFPEDMEGV